MYASARLGELTEQQLQQALDRFDLGTLQSVEAIPHGLFGQNVFLTTDAGEFVFRGCPHYDWQLPAEQHFAGVIHRQTSVAVPWPYHLSTDSGPFPWPWGYALMPRLPGIVLADDQVYKALTPDQRHSLAQSQGETLWRLQQATGPVAGSFDLRTGAIVPFPGGYVRRVADRARANAAAAFANGAHSEQDAAWLESTLGSLERLPEPEQVSVVHEDFNRNNMTAGIVDGRVVVSGLFDLMTCHYGDGLADLARQFSMYLDASGSERLHEVFVRSCLARRGAFGPDDRKRTLLYLIDERLLAWEYFTRPQHVDLDWWERGQSLRTWLERYLDAWNSVT